MPTTYALHLNAQGNVLGVKQFDSSYQCGDWMRGLSPEPGDRIEFKAIHSRRDEVEMPPPPPAFLTQAESDGEALSF